MNTNVLLAVFKRNFVSYFASPLGYVFICIFVLLSTVAAFFPYDFYNNNLANLDQLNLYFPAIMLVFIPAITMSIWADERRQGTDELLLTIPAGDTEIVVGKYLAAVAIYSVSLLFSLICTYAVLRNLGQPDLGLFLATYVGYWMVGLAMLAIGMVASFLTGNLTVSFILGVLFNVPLVGAVYADTILPQPASQAVRQWSIGEQFSDFGRGLITFSGLAYFLLIVAVMLYLAMILIARRHWVRGKGWLVQAGHYLVRALALVAVTFGVTSFLHSHDVRVDATSEKLSSLSPYTVDLLKNLQSDRAVQVEAFISPTVPESYVQTRLNLLSMLQELQARGGEKVSVRINRTERSGDEASRAEKRYGIAPRRVTTMNRGAMSEDSIFLGVAFTSGLQKVTLPFVDRGIPIEYEMVRSILTVTQQKRRKVGVLQTDAQLFGRLNMQTMSSSNNWPIIDELQKSYDVVPVDPAQPITEKYDVLLAVQPSSLAQEQMTNFIAAVKNGQPTAIFEDPFPAFAGYVPATSAPKRPQGMNPMMMQMNPAMMQKGNIGELWNLLGVGFSGINDSGSRPGSGKIVCQKYNPIPKLSNLPNEFVFVDSACGTKEPFNDRDPISSKLQHVLFPFPGYIAKVDGSSLQFTPLIQTGNKAGTVDYSTMVEMSPFGMGGGLNPDRRPTWMNQSYILAAHISGKVPPPQPMADEGKAEKKSDASKEAKDAKPAPKPQPSEVNVVLVADIDFLHEQFFRIRELGDVPEAGIHLDFDNVTFVLNAIDELAGDERFIEIRKRRPMHRTLTAIEKETENHRKATAEALDEMYKGLEKLTADEQKNLQDKIQKLKDDYKKQEMSTLDVEQRLGMVLKEGQQRIDANVEKLKRDNEKQKNEIENKLAMQVRRVQDSYKFWAVALPPIPPLALAVVFFILRRAREREGVPRSRLRS